MRRLAIPIALALAAPAQAADPPPWVGVWQGKVGNAAVRVCLNSYEGEPGTGAYYYIRYLEPISLSQEGSKWIEHAPGVDKEAQWQFATLTATRAGGTWRQGARQVPFSLTPVKSDAEDGDAGPCGSKAFFEPRLVAGEVVYADAVFEGLRYVKTSYRPPAHFKDDVSIQTFTYDADNEGDAAINATLSAHLPTGSWDDDYLGCIMSNVDARGTDGQWEETIEPKMVSRAYLAVEESSATDCGGAHPNYYTVPHTYDRRNGQEVDLFDWIGPARGKDGDRSLPEGVQKLVMARWPKDSDAECRDAAAESDFWSIGLSHTGLTFSPDFPHVLTACEEPVTVDWAALTPFLDAEGKAGLALLRAR
jgi:hypothetical protein